jgi:PPIC-type PPIASE domain
MTASFTFYVLRFTFFYVVSMAQTPKKSQPPTQRAPLTRRARSRHEREVRRQRLVIITSATAIGLALLAVLIGLGYDRLWVPSRPVAQVNNASLSRRDYWTERRNELARRLSQNLKNLVLLGSLGPQFAQQLAGQIPALNEQIPSIRTDPVDEETVNGWIDRQLIIEGAAGMNIQADDGAAAQQLIADLVSAFPAPPPPPTTTATLEPTAAVTGTTTAALTSTTTTATGTPVATTAATSTPGGPTETAAPTETPTATLLPEGALQQQDGMVGRLFDAYLNQLASSGGKTNLTIDDFKAALHDQYLRQALQDRIEAQLVPESSFTPTTDPSSIETRHILIAVTEPLTATDREAAYARRRPEAEAILQQLRAGSDFATLAKEKSDDAATKNEGGTLPSFDKDGKTQDGNVFDPAFVQAALALKEGEISDLVRTPFGWHIIQLVKRTVDSKENQLQAARSKKFDEWLAQQRAVANVEHFPPQTPTPTTLPTPEGTAAPLPTMSLYSTPTATPEITATATLTDTTALPAETPPAASGTPTVTPLPATAVPPATSTPAATAPAGTTPIGTSPATAVLPAAITPTGTPVATAPADTTPTGTPP